MPEPRSIPASFSVGALEEAVSRDLLDLRFEHGLLDSDIDYILRAACSGGSRQSSSPPTSQPTTSPLP